MQPEHLMPHPCRLQSIELRDFKSISHARVDFCPLTVVIGANSSGKSSLIQAILALSQAVRSEDSTGRFPLNGELVRLGTFEEVKNFVSEDSDSTIQMTAVVSPTWASANATRSIMRVMRYELDGIDAPQIDENILPEPVYTHRDKDLEECVSWSLQLTSDRTSSSTAAIKSLKFEAYEVVEYGMAMEWYRHSKTVMSCDLRLLSSTLDSSEIEMFVPRSSEIKKEPLLKVSGQFTNWQPWWLLGLDVDRVETHNCDAAIVIGGLPYAVYTKRSRIDSYSYCWWDWATYAFIGTSAIQDIEDFFQYVDRRIDEITELASKVVDCAEKHIRHMYYTAKADHETKRFRDKNDLQLLGPMVERKLLELSEKDQWDIAHGMVQMGEGKFRKLLRERFEDEIWASEIMIDESEQSEQGNMAGLAEARQARDFFEKSIRYLGPLRAAPQPLYNLYNYGTDLGASGEHAAAILHARASQEVLLPEIDGSSKRTNLTSAVAYWLQEFGMAESSRTEDRGRLGIDLRVSPLSTDRFVDLTSVGVGVSQVLPVILLCLLAEPGDLVILEQPELHLHPALQQKLADFFLECTRSGRQILVETHSEHLINRLRRRVAEDDSDGTESLVGLLFAEQHDGQTTFRESKINTYGGLSEDWPDGFLDLGAREAQSLVRSSLYKRRRMLEREDQLNDSEEESV